MHLTTLALTALAVRLSRAGVTIFTGPLIAVGDAQVLQLCVANLLANPHWDNNGWNCGNHHFQLGGSDWNSPSDCVGGCVAFLRGAASSGADWAKCDQQTGISAHCWVGWSQIGSHMCNDDSPCHD